MAKPISLFSTNDQVLPSHLPC